MFNFIKNFRKDEDGAVTVDWVVLTAAIVALAVVAFDTIGSEADSLIGEAVGDLQAEDNSGFTGGAS